MGKLWKKSGVATKTIYIEEVNTDLSTILKINLVIPHRRIQDIWWGVAELKKWGQFGTCGPLLSPSTGHWYFQSQFCLYGPGLGPKFKLFPTKIRIFFIKCQYIGPKSGALSCRGGSASVRDPSAGFCRPPPPPVVNTEGPDK